MALLLLNLKMGIQHTLLLSINQAVAADANNDTSPMTNFAAATLGMSEFVLLCEALPVVELSCWPTSCALDPSASAPEKEYV